MKATPQVVSLADVLAAVQGISERVSAVETGRAPVPAAPSRAPARNGNGNGANKVPSDTEYAKRSGWFRSSRTGAAMYYVSGKGRNVCLVAPEHVEAIVASIKDGGLDDIESLEVKVVLDPSEFQAQRASR